MPSNQSHSLFLYPITQSEIENEIDALNPIKAVGPYSIPVHILKRLKYLMWTPLEILYNLSILTGTVPDRFKIARVLAVYKKESHMNLSNYQPISVVSVFNRILERLIYHRLINYIDKNNLLYNRQFGFRAKHSTSLAILSITDKIQKAIEDNVYSCGIFLDFSKAFDTVNHRILLCKLEHYGIKGVAKDCFTSYLKDRKQFVSIGSVETEPKSISCGVPQGSVLQSLPETMGQLL